MIINEEFLADSLMKASETERKRINFDLRDSDEDNSQRMLNALLPGTVISRFEICPKEGSYGIQVPKGTWHSITIAEPSVIFEAKDGRYFPIQEEDIIR